MAVYYNENEPYAAEWLRQLIKAGHIPHGDVDERDIRDVLPTDLLGYTQCHFFAGIGGWPYALRLAGWPDDRPVWTGSCPCQPFSTAGKRKGFDDERHLWPAWFWLISQCRPSIVFGEQVARAKVWLDLVCSDLEGEGYACGAAILPAAGVDAPHIRERFWFVADTDRQGKHGVPVNAEMATVSELVSDARGAELRLQSGRGSRPNGKATPVAGDDGAARWWRTEPDVGRVAHGVPARVGKLRALGNAIVPQVAAEFIRAYDVGY